MAKKVVRLLDARLNLTHLLNQVTYQGHEITLTRRGVPVARIVPLGSVPPRLTAGKPVDSAS